MAGVSEMERPSRIRMTRSRTDLTTGREYDVTGWLTPFVPEVLDDVGDRHCIPLNAWEPADPQPEPVDPVMAAVCADLMARSKVGVRKYGVTLGRTDLTHTQWLQHAYEECLDQANYLKAAILSAGGV